MKKRILFAVLALFTAATVAGLLGCATVSSGGSTSNLPAGVAPGSPIPSPEATITGAVGMSGGVTTLNLGAIIPTGTTTPVPVELGRMSAYVATGAITGAVAKDATWSLLTLGFYDVSATPIDIVFVLDNTGSMGGTIDGVKDSISSFAATLEAGGIDAKFALVTYGDSALHPTPKGYITSESFTDATEKARPIMDFGTASQLQNVLSTEVVADGGGDGPENPLDCTKWALTTNTTTGAFENLTWRAGAQKVVIILTDINAHQNVAADTSSNNKCTTTATLEVARIRNFNAKVYAVSPNYTYSQTPYADVRMLADGFGEGRTTAEAVTYSSGGAWMRMPYGGAIDLSALGISTSIIGGSTIKIEGYTFASGTVYTIIVYYDVDGDGVLDSYAYFVFTYTTSSTGVPILEGKWYPADDGVAKPNN